MSPHARLALLALLLAAAGPAQAQERTLEPTAALRCLTPPLEQRGKPAYPEAELAFKTDGRVKVALRFTKADAAPAVEVLAQEGADAFVKSVREHVASYRVPCLTEAEGPSRLEIDFKFSFDNRKVSWTQPVDPDVPGRDRQLACVKHISGERAPAYASEARRKGIQGRVLALLRFEAPDQPPVAEIFAPTNFRPLVNSVRNWVQGYRMPCLEGGPVSSRWIFVHRLNDEVYGFKDLTLLQFMGRVRGINDRPLNLDMNTMSCPFEVKVRYTQPLLPNAVGEVGDAVASREPLLRWLSSAELDITPDLREAVFADSLTLSVPCIKINLDPKTPKE